MSSFLDVADTYEEKRKGKTAERGETLRLESWACI